ncbi:MAG: ferritin [Cohaesibacteraceae bacterium]|nr:ferritin [Cohaesibacteraceae bacterium]MBL4875154.1 ferritin [Cohaesibacteraceae bacterium]
MSFDSKIEAALNAQINNELNASYTYLAMAAYFESEDLPGFAAWFRGHAAEENDHAMKIFDFIYKRDGNVELNGIEKPKAKYGSAKDAVAYALAHEKIVTGQIHEIFSMCNSQKDFGTQNMLHWFLEEQVEEEDLFRRILAQVEATGGNKWYLTQLDNQLERGDTGETAK